MSYTNDAAIYKLSFTDGTFINMLNTSEYDPRFGPGQHEFIIPNFYMGDFDGLSYESTKYDKKGNKYVFSERGVVINDTINFTRQASRLCLGYDPVQEAISLCYMDPIPEFIPYMQKTIYDASGICYGRDTSGTVFDSFGEALVYGEERYNAWTPGTVVALYYNLESIVPRTKNIPLCGTTLFYGKHEGDPRTRDLLYQTHFVVSQYETLNISDEIEDFDPVIKPLPDDDPYKPGGEAGDDGAGGDFDDTSEPIDIPSLPSLSAADTGFITLFNPSLGQLQQLAAYMWTGAFDVNAFKKIFADPMDCILGLSIVPVAVPNGPTRAVTVGNISTGVVMTTAASQYVEVDCGSINVNEYWGAYLDYDPYTKAEIYLPFIGTHPVAVDDIMKKTVTIKYHVDILSGACTAYIKCGTSVLYQFIGQCTSSIPVTGNDWTNVINGVLSIAGSIGTMVATGGLSAPVSAGTVAALGATGGQIASTAINTMKPSIEKSGAISGTGGMLSVLKPYIILTRPRQALPRSQNSFMGYPSFITENLGALSGYTEVEAVHLSGIPGTDEELRELETLLYKGVIF